MNVKEDHYKCSDIAVVGMAVATARANSLKSFWEVLEDGVDCVSEIPPMRKKALDQYYNLFYPDAAPTEYSLGAYLSDISTFDYSFFNISKRDAILIDPNQRFFLTTSWKAFEDAGINPFSLKNRKTGVYVGYAGDEQYKQIVSSVYPDRIAAGLPGLLPSMISGRVSYQFNLNGPNMVINTSCSSSLVAIHVACTELIHGECDIALAGGVQIYALPKRLIKTGVEASDGRTKAFDDKADGTGTGEGCGVVILKLLSQAVKDNDRIYAVIKGSAVNSDGTSQGITAPNPASQTKVLLEAWKKAGIQPGNIRYIEAHGTGTRIGDPIEVQAINEAFRNYTDATHFCKIGSLKTNFGHLDSAAGIVGFVKSVLSLYHKKIPPSLHYTTPNRFIDFEHSAVEVNKFLQNWKDENIPRICGVSSFGMSGTNCHIVLQEFTNIDNKKSRCLKKNFVFSLSAKDISALHKLIGIYIDFLEALQGVSLKNICFTTNTGRCHFDLRIALVVSTIHELITKLTKLYVSGIHSQMEAHVFFSGDIHNFEETATQFNDLTANLGLDYVRGKNVKWDSLYESEWIEKVELPGYALNEKQCWIKLNNKNTESSVQIYGRTSVTATEKRLATYFANCLDINQLHVDDDFFEIGGDSLAAIHLLQQIQNNEGITIKYMEFVKVSSLARLAAYLDNLQAGGHTC